MSRVNENARSSANLLLLVFGKERVTRKEHGEKVPTPTDVAQGPTERRNKGLAGICETVLSQGQSYLTTSVSEAECCRFPALAVTVML